MAELCWVNREGRVSYRESTRQQEKKAIQSTSAAPWNQFTHPKVETSNMYDALTGAGKIGRSLPSDGEAKKKKKQLEDQASVLDDWEAFEG